MTLYAYQQIEQGQREDRRRAALSGGLRDHERCHIARTRAGMRLEDLGEKVGLSKFWICQMERGTAPLQTLLDYWQCQG